jgi:acyl-CoA hydrolase
MLLDEKKALLERWRERYPEKFATEETIFSKIRRGHHIFISTGCGEPQYLVRALVNYVQSHPKGHLRCRSLPRVDSGCCPIR